MAIKQISFDLWNTLIRANPAYAEARTELLFSQYNPNGLSRGRVNHIYKVIDRRNDWLLDRMMVNLPTNALYGMLLHDLGITETEPTEHAQGLIERLAELCIQYPPMLYDGNTAHVLKELRSLDYILSITSNTAFLTGDMLMPVLNQILPDVFSAKLFSDRYAYAKPNRQFFNEITYQYPRIPRAAILHVGDNPVADYAGAINAGLNALLINSNGLSITDVMTHISHARTI